MNEPPESILETLRRLASFRPIFDQGFDFGHWEPSRRTEDGAYTLPYFVPSANAEEFLRACPVLVFGWPAWLETDEGRRLRDDRSAIADATPEQLFKLLTAVIRSERFGEGNIVGAYESGLLTAVVRRADALVSEHDRERAGAE
jgi:hypothetical protein